MTNAEIIAGDNPLDGLKDDWGSASKYLSMFIDDAQHTLDEITDALLALEAGGGRENVQRLFVAVHRLKGSAASIGLRRTAKLAHLAEDLLQELVDNGREFSSKTGNSLLTFADGLRTCIEAMRRGSPEEDQFDVVVHELLAARQALEGDGLWERGDSPPLSVPQAVSDAAVAKTAAADRDRPISSTVHVAPGPVGASPPLPFDLHRRIAAASGQRPNNAILAGKVVFEPDLPLVGLKVRLLYEKLSNWGEVSYFDPPVENVENCERLDAVTFGLVTTRSAKDIKRMVHLAGIHRMVVEPLAVEDDAPHRAETTLPMSPPNASPPNASPPNASPQSNGAESAANHNKPVETLRVDIERLDQLMNLTGQLAIDRSHLMAVARRLKEALAENQSAQSSMGELIEAIEAIDGVGADIQQVALNMRMVPIGPLFARFHRVVRDVAKANGKDIRLVLSGEKTELDKRMIDELGDPLIHAIRNAADHGIESPDEREAAGKPRQGTISLDASHRGGNVIIRISDDGGGFDAERLRARAVEMGILPTADAHGMTPRELYRLAWTPGLSTAAKPSEVSGRGIGMDIIRAKIEELNGSVELETSSGHGTTITIQLPLTLAILPSLMTEIDGNVFAVPLDSVVEILHVGRGDVSTVQGYPTTLARGRVLPIVTLNALFGGVAPSLSNIFHHAGKIDNGAPLLGTNSAERNPLPQHCLSQAAAHDDEKCEFDAALVVLGRPDRQVGLAVNRVIGQEDVVVKSLAANYRNVAGVAGAGISGNGRVFLILDPPTLMENLLLS